jgi:hypothetical protein
MSKDEVDRFDIATLHRELRDFRRLLESSSMPQSAVEESAAALVLSARETDLDGDTAGALKVVLRLLFRRLLMDELARRQQATIKKKIEDFRNDVSHVLFAVER